MTAWELFIFLVGFWGLAFVGLCLVVYVCILILSARQRRPAPPKTGQTDAPG